MSALLLCCVLLASPLPSPENIRTYDGDTIIVDFPTLPDVFGKDLPIRLAGIDTPEMHDPNPVVRAWAVQARNYLHKRITAAKSVTLSVSGRDKFFRLDAKVFVDGADVQAELLAKKYAKPYNGGTKQPWTPADVPSSAKEPVMRRRGFLRALMGLPLVGVAATLVQEEKVLGAFRYATPEEQAEAIKNGWNDQQFFGKRWIETVKPDRLDQVILDMIAEEDAKFLAAVRAADFPFAPLHEPRPPIVGRSCALEETTLYVKRESYMLEFFAYETQGGVVDYTGNLKQLAQAKFV